MLCHQVDRKGEVNGQLGFFSFLIHKGSFVCVCVTARDGHKHEIRDAVDAWPRNTTLYWICVCTLHSVSKNRSNLLLSVLKKSGWSDFPKPRCVWAMQTLCVGSDEETLFHVSFPLRACCGAGPERLMKASSASGTVSCPSDVLCCTCMGEYNFGSPAEHI